MIKLTIRIKAETQSYTETHLLPEEFEVAKSNEKLYDMVKKACDTSKLETIQDVVVTARFEW